MPGGHPNPPGEHMPGIGMMVVGALLFAFGLWGMISGQFGYDVFSIHDLDPTSARIAGGSCGVTGVGCFAMGLGQRLIVQWLVSIGARVAALGFVAMLVGPLFWWMVK